MSLWGPGPGQPGDQGPRKPPRLLGPTTRNNQEAKLANNTNKVRDEVANDNNSIVWGDQYYQQGQGTGDTLLNIGQHHPLK